MDIEDVAVYNEREREMRKEIGISMKKYTNCRSTTGNYVITMTANLILKTYLGTII